MDWEKRCEELGIKKNPSMEGLNQHWWSVPYIHKIFDVWLLNEMCANNLVWMKPWNIYILYGQYLLIPKGCIGKIYPGYILKR